MRIRILTLLLLTGIAAAAQPLVRHYGTADGLSHRNIRDIMQDSLGYMWFATWRGVDRFDGYEFRNYHSFPSDSVKLDNNRIERLALDNGGNVIVETYGRRHYCLNSTDGTFSLAGDCDRLLFGKERPHNQRRPELAGYNSDSPLSYVDRDGNLWIARSGGIDFVTAGNNAFRFLDSIGSEIHTVYAAPDGRIWAGSRDTRIMVYGPDGRHIGNLSADGRIVPDSRVPSGVKAYSFMADSDGRMWIGTKSKRLLVLTPDGPLSYSTKEYRASESPGDLHCSDIYDIKQADDGTVWLATFGAGIACASIGSDGNLSFRHPATFPDGMGRRIRRILQLSDSCIIAAATDGVAVFDPTEQRGYFNHTELSRRSSLSNDDVLNIISATDGSIYLSAFSGGIDCIAPDAVLFSDSIAFSHRNIRSGLCVDPVLSVTEDARGCFWVASTYVLARYDSSWQLMSVFDRSNLGRQVEFTEAAPQLLSDGRIVFGISRGLLIVDPLQLGHCIQPPLVITGIESSGRGFGYRPGDIISLPRGSRDMAISFAALQYAGAHAIRYAWHTDDSDTWIDLGHERTLRLSSLPAGTCSIFIRSTDAYGIWADNTICITVDVPYTATEIIYMCLTALCITALLVLAALATMRTMTGRRRQRLLDRCVETALHGGPQDGFMGQVAALVGRDYPDEKLKAERLAAALNMPRNELRRLVRQDIGISIEDFIRTVRVKAACDLLGAGGLTVAETAYRCGFSTPQYMSMVFKEHTGVTPGEYIRKSCK